MTANQRERRLRQLDAQRDTLAARLRAIDAEARVLEAEIARSLGYWGLRGKALIAAMDRDERRVA